MRPAMEGHPVQVGPHPVPQAAGMGSTLNWNSGLEKNHLTCFNSSLLNVGIAHMYFNV